jgi:hypothetical protein
VQGSNDFAGSFEVQIKAFCLGKSFLEIDFCQAGYISVARTFGDSLTILSAAEQSLLGEQKH